MYTQQEVFRTAQPYVSSTLGALSFGDKLTHGINEVCICCKSKGNGITNNDADYQSFSLFYKTKQWKAYSCPSCGYQWSWYKDNCSE